MNNKNIYYQKDWERLLEEAKEYYENHKEKLKQQARNKYNKLPDKKKDKKIKYGRNRYRNMSKKDKQKLKECYKNYCKAKICMYIFIFLYWIKNEWKHFNFWQQIAINKVDISSFGRTGSFK